MSTLSLVAVISAGLIAAQPADANIQVTPLVDCITIDANGIVTVYFGYTNPGTQGPMPFGDLNQVVPGIGFQGQPVVINAGTYERVFRAHYNSNAFASVQWELNGTAASAPHDDPALLCKGGVTAPASGLTVGTATLNGAVDPGGDATTWHFAYGPTTGYGQTTPDQTATGTQTQLVQAGITGLQPSSTYHFKLVTNNSTAGTTSGADQTFTTPGPAAVGVDLSMSKSAAPTTLSVGQNLTYTLTATNNSSGAATGVTISDPVPGGATFTSAAASQGSCTFANATDTVTCVIGGLAAAQAATVTIVVTPTQPSVLTNTGIAAGDQADPNHANDFQATRTTVTSAPTRFSTANLRFTG